VPHIGAPGGRTQTQGLHPGNPGSQLDRRLHESQSLLVTIETDHIPALRRAVDMLHLGNARRAALELRVALEVVSHDLRAARRVAERSDTNVLDDLDLLDARQHRVIASAEPVLALAPRTATSAGPTVDEICALGLASNFASGAADTEEDAATWRARVGSHASQETVSTDPATALASTQPTGLGDDRVALETAFGVSLDGVRLHDDLAATRMTEGLGAQAFAIGDRIALPRAVGGDRAFVLAHEIAHVVQQRGGTGGAASDPEEAAEAAAHAFIIGLPIPAQPATAVGVARRGTSVRTQPRIPVEGRDPNAYGNPQDRVSTNPTIGNQNGVDAGSDTDWNAVAAQAALRGDLDSARRVLEQPRPTIEDGGAAPHFITAGGSKQANFSGPSADQQRNLRIDYTAHRFHVRTAIFHDLIRARSLNEIASIWRVYLADNPHAPPWPLWAEADTPGPLVLPAGSPMDPNALVIVQIGDKVVWWSKRLTPFPEDRDGAVRVGTLTVGIEAMAGSDLIPELAELVNPRRKRKAKTEPQGDRSATPG
jgi:hypothetical protein